MMFPNHASSGAIQECSVLLRVLCGDEFKQCGPTTGDEVQTANDQRPIANDQGPKTNQ